MIDKKTRRRLWWQKKEKEMRDRDLIRLIAQRGSQLVLEINGNIVNPAFIENEITIVHFDICRLRLDDLLNADDGNFAHDIAGIHENLDILNGSFRNNWSPRFAK